MIERSLRLFSFFKKNGGVLFKFKIICFFNNMDFIFILGGYFFVFKVNGF